MRSKKLHTYARFYDKRGLRDMKNDKERKKIIRELLNVTDKEFTDEELIRQLISTEITENSDKTEKITFGQRAADAVGAFCRQLGVHLQFYRRNDRVDGCKRDPRNPRLRRLSVHFAQLGSVVYCGCAGSAYHDEPEPAGGERSRPRRKRLQNQSEKRTYN